jgi:cobalamin biosynthesis Mg chelatase CobN
VRLSHEQPRVRRDRPQAWPPWSRPTAADGAQHGEDRHVFASTIRAQPQSDLARRKENAWHSSSSSASSRSSSGGAVIKGILWVLLIAAVLVVAALYVGYRKLKGLT